MWHDPAMKEPARLSALRDRDTVSPIWIALLAVFLPMPVKRWIYNTIFGWSVSRSARVGLSLLHGNFVTLEAGCYIGHFNIFKELGEIAFGENVYVKHFNHFFAQDMPEFKTRELRVGDRSQIMSHHFFDISGTVRLGTDCIVGGRDSQFWSHSAFGRGTSRQLEPRTLQVGDFCYIGARATLVHCAVPNGCTVAAGAVVNGTFDEEDSVIAGNPATKRTGSRRLPKNRSEAH